MIHGAEMEGVGIKKTWVREMAAEEGMVVAGVEKIIQKFQKTQF